MTAQQATPATAWPVGFRRVFPVRQVHSGHCVNQRGGMTVGRNRGGFDRALPRRLPMQRGAAPACHEPAPCPSGQSMTAMQVRRPRWCARVVFGVVAASGPGAWVARGECRWRWSGQKTRCGYTLRSSRQGVGRCSSGGIAAGRQEGRQKGGAGCAPGTSCRLRGHGLGDIRKLERDGATWKLEARNASKQPLVVRLGGVDGRLLHSQRERWLD